MVDMFYKRICNCCKNSNCKKNIFIKKDKNVITFKCSEYIKDTTKIIPYEAPLIVTAKRDYITYVEK